MDRVIFTAMMGASAAEKMQAGVAQNLANINTDGYRAEEHRFRAVRVQTHNFDPEALPTRTLTVAASAWTDYSEGVLRYTGKEFDIAVRDKGWIAVSTPDGGEAYTRSGSLSVNVNGVLETKQGLPVQGDGGPISIPPDTVLSIASDGTVSATPRSGNRETANVVGRIKLVNPPEEQLQRSRDGLFRLTDGGVAPLDENTRIAAGYVESSNVNAANELIDMVTLSRQFEMLLKLITTAESNDRSATQILQAAR